MARQRGFEPARIRLEHQHLPLLLLPQWTFAIAFRNPVEAGAGLASALWGDFGFCVVLIGVGYLFIARRPAQERVLIFLARSATARDGELGVC